MNYSVNSPAHSSMHSSVSSGSMVEDQDDNPFMKMSGRQSLMKRKRNFALSADSVYNSIVETNSFLNLNLKDQCFSITEVSREYIASITGKCYVVSVSGAPLSGKSTILNLMLSILSHYVEGLPQTDEGAQEPILYTNVFKIGDGNKRTTDGLDYFCLRAGNDHIIFLDLEGDNDPVRKDTGVWIYSNLVTTALSVSHVHLYNYTNYAGQHFLKYFDSISRIIKQNHLHDTFQPLMYLVKKDHPASSDEDLQIDTQEISESLKEHLEESGLDYNVKLLNKPPEHLVNKRCKTSCIKLQNNICQECQESSYIRSVQDLALTIFQRLKDMPAYNNGSQLLELVDKILEINRKDLPYVVDMGCIAKIREAKLNKELHRVQTGIADALGFSLEKDFSKQIQKLLSDQQGLIEMELVNQFERTLNRVLTKLAQSDYLLMEISKFYEESLLDRSFTILNEKEKDMTMKIYLIPFQQTMKEALKAFREYQSLLGVVDEKLKPVKDEVHKYVKEYSKAAFDYKSRSTVLGVQSFSSFALSMIAREAALRAVALGFGGIGILVGIAAIVAFTRVNKRFQEVKKKNDKLVNVQSVPGIDEAENAKQQMEKVVDYLKKTTTSIQNKNEVLDAMLAEDIVPDEDKLTQLTERMLEMKRRGEDPKEDDKDELMDLFEKVKEKVETLKDCI